ncbi:MAG TPA: sialate O-acetylesterase [Saprospiraceae bacterium]|nr:sialate O-acetylesterase [Saprospiraceae bacterium]
MLGLSSAAHADIRLPAIFGSHAVLQQQQSVRLWGWAAPNDDIQISCSWLPGHIFKTRADRSTLRWSVEIPGTEASFTPHTLTIRGSWQEITLSDLLFGEVWLCSGQSNMEWPPAWGNVNISEEQYQASQDPRLRFFTVPHVSVADAQDDCTGAWKISDRNTMSEFSAVAYFFGRALRDRLGVPVGLVNASWGGTPIESWMHSRHFEPGGSWASIIHPRHPVWKYGKPGSQYNGMIAPLTALNIKGFLWYQGETNTYNSQHYAALLEQMVADWRQDFRSRDLPFYYVQIAPYRYDIPREGAALRDAQRRALPRIQPAGMVVVSDIGDTQDIHPSNKADVGKRLAALALTRTYGAEKADALPPLFREMRIEGNKARVFFDHAAEGLRCTDARPAGFEVAGSDRKFYPAEARIEGDAVLLQSREVPQPVAVRFAFQNTAEPRLTNAAGLPASCFRTDDWPAVWPNPIFRILQAAEQGDARLQIELPDPTYSVRYVQGKDTASGHFLALPAPDSLILLKPGDQISVQVLAPDGTPSDRFQHFRLVSHLATGRAVTASVLPNDQYPGSSGARTLTDGLLGSPNTKDPAWAGYMGDSPAWTIDLGAPRLVRHVRLGVLVNTRSWVFPPSSVSVEVSDDGQQFRLAGTVSEPVPTAHRAPEVRRIELPLGLSTRYLRIVAHNVGTLPDWHPSKGNTAWLFADEVEVE